MSRQAPETDQPLDGPQSRSKAHLRNGRYDAGVRRRAARGGRQRGCSIYIPAEELDAAGWPLDGEKPWYRIWPGKDARTIIVRLYQEGP